jgi:hypothetical protein
VLISEKEKPYKRNDGLLEETEWLQLACDDWSVRVRVKLKTRTRASTGGKTRLHEVDTLHHCMTRVVRTNTKKQSMYFFKFQAQHLAIV